MALLLSLTLLVLSACTAQPDAIAAGDEIAEVVLGDLSANATAAGTLTARRSATLQAPTSARVTEAHVRPGESVTAGQPLVSLDTTAAALDVASAQLDVRRAEAALAGLTAAPSPAELAVAQAGVESAQTSLDVLLAGPTAAQLASYRASLRAAEASVASASADLTGAQNSVTEADLATAEASLAAARLQLSRASEANKENTNQETHEALLAAEQAAAEAQARVDELRAGPDTAASQSGVGAAAARLESSRADYNRQTAGATAVEIASAEAQLADSLATLANLENGPSAADVAAAEADLESARLALADAEEMLARMTIVAPFDGVVTAVSFQPGEVASGSVVELLDLTSLQIILQVDEVDVGQLADGQEATVTVQSFPGVSIPAEIAAIAATSTALSSGGVAYDVRLDLAETALPLFAGMTADASLLTAEKQGVVLVPNAAIRVDRTNGSYSAMRMADDGTFEEVPITVGLRDAQFTEVTSGLEVGDRVQLGGITQSSSLPGGAGLFSGGGN